MSDSGAPESHGVHGAQREDGMMQEEPVGADGADRADEETRAEQADTGADAS